MAMIRGKMPNRHSSNPRSLTRRPMAEGPLLPPAGSTPQAPMGPQSFGQGVLSRLRINRK